jgi:hypothetical protein
MASKSLGTLTLDLVAKTAGFSAGLTKAERDSAKFKKKVSDNMAGAAKTSATAATAMATAAVAGIALIVNSQRELIDQQLITAQSLNTTYASMSNLERAGDLAGVGMETVEKAAGKLALNIGKAIQGSDAQVEAFDRLGLSAQALYDMPLDERISAINTALKENVQESERATVAAEIYGAKNAIAMQLLDGETIAEAARQAQLFGTALSDVDASKVEAANDSISVMSLGLDGIGQQLTVQLAPAIDAAGKLFLQAAEDSGGLGNAVESAVDTAITATSFLMNAADGVGRTFEIVADSILIAFQVIGAGALKLIREAIALADKIPGIDFTQTLADFDKGMDEGFARLDENIDGLKQKFEEPLAGDKFRKFWDDAKISSQEAAEQAVKTRAEAVKTGEARKKAEEDAAKAAQKAQEAIEGELTALERAAKTWGMSADQVKIYDLQLKGANETQLSQAQALLDTVSALEAQKEATEEYQKVAEGLRTEEERRTDTLLSQLSAIEAVNDAESGKNTDRAIDAAFEKPDMQGVGEIASGPFEDLFKVNEKEKELEDWYATQMEMLETFRSERSDLSAEWDEKELEVKAQHEAAMQQLETARYQAALSGVSDILGQIQGAIDTDSKKGKEKAKKLAIAQALINTFTGATGAFASAASIPLVGWVMAPIAAAAAIAAGMANVNAIKGQAHDGIMSVPSSGTWNLEKGERVTTANTSAKLDATLERVQNSMNATRSNGSGSSRGLTVNQTINTQGRIDNRTSNQIAIDSNRKQRIAQARFG